MATSLFNGLIITASQRLKDARTDPTVNGDIGRRYSSSLLQKYANQAVRDLLLAQLNASSDKFSADFSDYVKPGNQLALTQTTTGGVTYGIVPTPAEAFLVISLQTTAGVKFRHLKATEIQDVKLGVDGLIVPSATNPVFWEENGSIWTLGVVTGNVIPRYVRTHQDITVSTSAAGAGKKNSGNGSYAAASQTLTIAMTGNFVQGTDENDRIMFWDNAASKVYYARIGSIPSTGACTLLGDGLPTVDIAAGNITICMMATNDITDLILDQSWFEQVLDGMLKYAMIDAKNFAG